MAEIFRSVSEWRKFRALSIFNHKSIGFVPTMGNLHAGHQQLLRRSISENTITVMSLFVNPTQFANTEEYKNFPRNHDQDLNIALQEGVDFVLFPDYESVYPYSYCYRVTELELSHQLIGNINPKIGSGLLTATLKFLNLVKPHNIYFSENDYLEIELIRGMIGAFFFDTKIVACPTIHTTPESPQPAQQIELNDEQKKLAKTFSELLKTSLSSEQITQQLHELGFDVDYVEEYPGRRFASVRLGKIKLTDNVAIN